MRWLLLLLAFIPYSAPQLQAADKPVPTSEAAAKMKVPPGFHVTLFAGEPDIVQPIAFTFDDRGRMWVVECLSYPKWSRDGKGHDRVVILEDTDGDGKHDKKTVVIDNGVNLSGIEFGFGGVWLCSSPNLIFVPIADDKPSGPPVIHLDGWNMTDTKHTVFNSLIWGPDGYLYGCNGIQAKAFIGAPGTPKEKRAYMDCGVWRYHPTKKNFEVVATGTTNPWGLDFDEHGEMFITNCVIDHLFHVVPGGRYERMYGQDSNPYAFGLMSSAVDYKHWGGGHWTDGRADLKTGLKKQHDDAGGGHAHSGAAIYLGDNFPKEYRNTLFTCNIHGNRLNNDGLERTPSGMKGVRRPDFLFANDPWFRGICVKQGPDGGLYVSDWSDTGECHNYDVADISNGRIYRTIYGDRKSWKGDVSKMTDAELWNLHSSKNEWLVRKARRVLQERQAAGQELKLPSTDIDVLNKRIDETIALRLLFTRLALGKPLLVVGKTMPESLRLCSVRALDQFSDAELRGTEPVFLETYARDSSPAVRAAMLSVLAKLPIERAFTLASIILTKDVADNADAKLSQLYWLGIQPAVLAKPDEALKLVNAIAIRRVRTNIVRLVLTLPNSEPTKQLDAVFPILASAPNDETRQDILQGIVQAFEERKSVVQPKNWNVMYMILSRSQNAAIVSLANDVALKFNDPRAIADMIGRIAVSGDASERNREIALLAARKTDNLPLLLRTLLLDPTVRRSAIIALSNYSDDTTPAAILKVYAYLTADEKADAVQTLSSRASYAMALLDAVEKGTVAKADITAFTARQIATLKDQTVVAKLKAVWGEVKPASANRNVQIAKYKAMLSPDMLKTADEKRGRVLFAKNCATCHKLFGEGQVVGPELTGSQRSNLDYVLENVVDPSAAVANEYKMTAFYLFDGRLVTGIIRKDSPNGVTVRTVNEELFLPVADIETRKPTPNSVMPEGLLDTMKPDEIRDLIAYLQKN